jgi:N-acetylmuramoyl-L-alanine amidase
MAEPEKKEEKVNIPQVVPQKPKAEEKQQPVEEPKPAMPVEEAKPEKADSAEIAAQVAPETREKPEEPVVKEEPQQPVVKEAPKQPEAPVFKVQFLISSKKLSTSDARMKGLKNVGYYLENGMHKYTVGSSTNYNEIYRLRKEILDKFPEAFIIAFKDGARMNVQEAIREFKNNKNRK